MSINVSSIVSEYGAYYIKSDQNMQRLKRQLLFGAETAKMATQQKTEDTIFRLANGAITDLVQPFQKGYTPKGDVTFEPNPIPLFNMKVDFDIYPDEIKNSWMAFLESGNLDRKDWPLVRYMMEQFLAPKIADNMELKEYYKGVYAAPTPGTAGLTGTSMNGFKLTLKDDSVNHFTMDPLDAATIYDQLEAAYEQISEVYQDTPMIVGMAPKWRRAFLKDKRAQGFYEVQGPGQIDDTLDFSPARVRGLPSMIGTNDIFITPQENFLHITRYGENAAKFKVEESKRCVSILTDWWEGIGFGLKEIVWTNVPAQS